MPAPRHTLDPKLDIVFWMLFARESNRALLISLLTTVLQPAVPITVVELLDPELDLSAIDDKGVVLDLRVSLATGEQVDIEMQSRPHPALAERFLYYWARLYSEQLARGGDYGELHRTIGVLFADFSMSETARFHSIFRVYEQLSRALFSEHLELHVIELPHLRFVPSENYEPELALWGKFLSATSDAELEALAQEHPIMTQAKAALEQLSDDPVARQRAEYRRMSEMAYWTGINAARREGREEGKAEGREQGLVVGKCETLRKQLILKFGGLSPAVVERLSAASEAELDRWLERILSATILDEIFGKSKP
jgi:predicted transposase/invertase (TIGR01784 family)